ncbi:MAG: UDP-N-acetylmuramoyl-L-alanine--D-glutamate ligase [Holosporaceae bacterium]|jgi:UDP-N-acetylmuramoylalanine--D-glutamate ligase|nr:UDP-N-acetylmuramoyl-L-alanine--D-glutamate ligase [Holosporaceae bacterium]
MIFLDFYKNKRVGVIGLGKTGESVVNALIASGAEVRVYDDYIISHKKCNAFNIDDVAQMNAMVVSPGVGLLWPSVHPMIQTAHKNAIPILNDVDLFQQHISGKNICITGTNGKSTTTALVYHVFSSAGEKTAIGGNFGNSLLSLAPQSEFFVLELSSYQLESCHILGFDTAILLNITPDHLKRHGGMEGYIYNKQKIFANFHEKSTAVIGVDDRHCLKIFQFLKNVNHPCVIPISGNHVPKYGVGWNKNKLIDNSFGFREVICEKNPILDGIHNRQNIAAAYVACRRNGLSKELFSKGLFSFRGLEHRQELVANIDNVLYINDSKATNADSVEQALKRFDNIVWILGGRPKEEGIENLVKYFSRIKFALLIGEAAENWSKLLAKHGVENEITKTLDVAVKRAKEISKTLQADVVLLSPACASFDQFKDFEERGSIFKQLVSAEKC